MQSEIQEIQALCAAITTQLNPITQKAYKEKEIAILILNGDANAATKFSQAKSDSSSAQLLQKFCGKTRAQIIADLKTTFAEPLKNANYRSVADDLFRFKQYFMGGNAADERKVEAAQLDLYYKKSNENRITYTHYKLYIRATQRFEPFLLEGNIRNLNDTALVLTSENPDYHATTILRITPSFCKIGPFDNEYYHAFYLTYTSVHEQIAGPVLLEMTDSALPFDYSVPESIAQMLHNTRHNIAAPIEKY
jgi:hypothetical protein